ncbi:MAG TPA: glycosyltransferase [Thermoflexales bacterium]|nr:glycosyltransferase [Thermoflexales bacterium]
MNIAIIIVSWNVREMLRGCLQSLQADGVLTNGALPGNRVIVVDSASSDGTPAMLRADFPDVELIACETNVGLVKGNNLALRRILGDGGRETGDGHSSVLGLPSSVLTPYIWFLNPDTLVHPGAT